MFDTVFNRFIEQSPIPVMLNSVLERTLSPEKIDSYFEQATEKQYTRGLLFSSIFEVMGLVVFKVFPAINAAYKQRKIIWVFPLHQFITSLMVWNSAYHNN